MASKICLVLHRKSANEPAIKEAVKQARRAGHDLSVRIPWNKKEKARVVRDALEDGATRIIAGGGDGTINAVVNALVRKGKKRAKATMGILPLGTANDFARGLGLPVTDLSRCLEIGCSWPARRIDVAKANSRYFINVTSGGFGAEITATTPVDMKKKLRGAAYTIMGLVKVRNLQPYRGRLVVPGEEPIEGGMLIMAVGNNRLAGGGYEVAPDAVLDDGLLDLVMVLHHPKMDLIKAAAELKNPTNPENQYVYYRQLSEFTIEAEREVHFNLDGEPARKSKITFSVLPRHLGVAF